MLSELGLGKKGVQRKMPVLSERREKMSRLVLFNLHESEAASDIATDTLQVPLNTRRKHINVYTRIRDNLIMQHMR